MNRFAENLRRIRFERHMTQEEFATMLGTTKQNISRYESGAVSPKISTAQIIADKLGLTLAELNGDPDRLFAQQENTPQETAAVDDDVWAAREALRDDPYRKSLVRLARHGSAEDVRQVAAIIDALRATNPEFWSDDD